VLGVNHYVTSDRVLVDDLSAFPQRLHGGNGRHRYVDVEAVRCLVPPPVGLNALLRKAYERYALPIAMTEVHIDASRDDQLRWLMECWRAANDAASDGVDVRAFTPWSLLGSFDWNSLVTESKGYYESGAFDVRGAAPRPTAIARAIRQIASGQMPDHPVLAEYGWWRRDGRLSHSVTVADTTDRPHPRSGTVSRNLAPLLITGASGTLGRAFARVCERRGLRHHLLNRQQLDISDEGSIHAALSLYRPWGIINAAGFVRVDDAELEIERCYRENTLGPRLLAKSCAAADLPLLTFSSDLVFDGDQDVPYVEDDAPGPLSIYGWSKAKSEAAVLQEHEGAMIIRTSAFFGPWDSFNHVARALSALRNGESFAAASDLVMSPTYVPDLVRASLDLMIDGESGIWHLTNEEPVSWWELTMRAAAYTGVDPKNLEAVSCAQLQLRAPRPRFSALSSIHPGLLPSLDDALARYHRDTRA
jgi:dTDP-4-dehydrorhamnose reductase